jgi:3-hydroxymyristoyl/3-hydroxydecanoyl-(acyl carrier protein) dehydratase
MTNQFLALPKKYEFISNDNYAEINFIIKDLPDIELHFPNHILIAGYYQFVWIEYLAKKACPQKHISQIKDTKFNEQIVPNDQITIRINWNSNSETCDFKIIDLNQTIKTQGKFRLSN